MSFRQRDEWLRFRCRSCSFEVQVREGGNPYLYDWMTGAGNAGTTPLISLYSRLFWRLSTKDVPRSTTWSFGVCLRSRGTRPSISALPAGASHGLTLRATRLSAGGAPASRWCREHFWKGNPARSVEKGHFTARSETGGKQWQRATDWLAQNAIMR